MPPWLVDDALLVSRDDLECNFDDVMPALTSALEFRPTWLLTIDVSGRIDGTAEVRQLMSTLLQHGGVAMDDYSDHLYTAAEVRSIAAGWTIHIERYSLNKGRWTWPRR